ncbi:hypothetical protein [Streptomyces sp. NPDC048445]|uniref:hypothetical protein n=1 Tax=Streptomyces sp. NPDC048445 TaxID=3365553 RepID=UPI00371E37A0
MVHIGSTMTTERTDPREPVSHAVLAERADSGVSAVRDHPSPCTHQQPSWSGPGPNSCPRSTRACEDDTT